MTRSHRLVLLVAWTLLVSRSALAVAPPAQVEIPGGLCRSGAVLPAEVSPFAFAIGHVLAQLTAAEPGAREAGALAMVPTLQPACKPAPKPTSKPMPHLASAATLKPALGLARGLPSAPSPPLTSEPPPPPPPTATPEPTPPPPAATATGAGRGVAGYGITRLDPDAWPTVQAELGVQIVELLARSTWDDREILAYLDRAEAMGLQVLFHIYEPDIRTNNPWDYDRSGAWSVTRRGQEILALIEGHPAVWAVYMLHEPLDSSGYRADAESMRALYALLKRYTGHPLYSDIGAFAYWIRRGEDFSDGMCDYCASFADDDFAQIDADMEAARRYMPNATVVFLINTYDLGRDYRMPSAQDLRATRDHMNRYDQVHLYYPWSHSAYERTLRDLPELWSVIAEERPR